MLYDAGKKLVRLLLEESKKVITKIDTDIAVEIETKYPETTREEREKIKRKYKNIEWKLEVKRNKKWEKFRFRESNQKRQNKTHNATSLLPKLNIKIPSQNVNQNSLKDTPTLIKRSFADVVNDGTNETKAVEETKIDERNIIDNRARRNKNKVKREEKKDGNLEKIDLKKIYSQLLEEEQSKSDSGFSLIEEDIFSTQDKEFLSVLEELQTANVSNNIDSITRHPTACTPQEKAVRLESRQNITTSFAYPRYGVTSEGRLEGYFCSDTVFNLSRKVLTDTEIRILEKGLDFAPIQNKINEPELRTDFEEFCRRMRTKWHFRNEPTLEFSETPVFSTQIYLETTYGSP